MKLKAAIFSLGDTPVAVLPVKAEVAEDIDRAKAAILKYRASFPGCTLVLMGMRNNVQPTYVGKSELVHQLEKLDASELPWQEVDIAAAPSVPAAPR